MRAKLMEGEGAAIVWVRAKRVQGIHVKLES